MIRGHSYILSHPGDMKGCLGEGINCVTATLQGGGVGRDVLKFGLFRVTQYAGDPIIA